MSTIEVREVEAADLQAHIEVAALAGLPVVFVPRGSNL